jgi:hypothetical protein
MTEKADVPAQAEGPPMVLMPLELSREMMLAVHDSPLTSCASQEVWYERLGWLICAYEVLIKNRPGVPSC